MVVVLLVGASLIVTMSAPVRAATTLRVPEDYSTISAAITAAAPGDTIDVAPGVYTGGVTLNKSVTLRGRSPGADPRNNTTILEAASTVDVITIPSGVSPAPTVTGLVLRNGLSGVSTKSPATIAGNLLAGNNDQVDYKMGGGGICRDNVFQDALDDGVDINHPVRDLVVENNQMVNSQGDGVEMRLNDDAIGSTAHITFRGNQIWGTRSDGIQIIDYYTDTNRVIAIERNLIRDNGRAGVGLLDNGTTVEDYRAASIRERITVLHNTLVRNNHGISGGDNLIALNNVFVGHVLALKNVDAGSVASHNLYWQNTTNASGSIVDSSIVADPSLDAGYKPQPSSPAIDAGIAHFEWNGDVVLDEAPGTYRGSAPDLGWQESSSSGGGAPPTMSSVSVTPASPGTNATVTANAAASDPDGDPVSFTYQWLKNGSTIAGATSSTLNLAASGNGDRGDQMAVTVRASDGSNSSAPMTSAAVVIVNTDPTFNQDVGDRSSVEGDAVNLPAGAMDADGDPLTFEATGLPPGLSIDGGTGLVSGTIAAGAAGSSPFAVSITVRDGASVDATDTFSWTVTITPAGGIVFRGAAGKAISARSKLAILRPPAVVAGDVEVASILVLGAAVVTPPPGWSVVRTDVNGSVWRQIAYVHVAGSAEPASYTWKLSVTSKAAGTLAGYGGVDPASPIVTSNGQVNASSTSIVAPGVTNPASGGLLVGFFGIVTDPLNSVMPPGGMTERVEVTPASGKPKPAIELADVMPIGVGDTGSRIATASIAGANVGQLLILRAGGP
jgi:hypothetical protein